MGGPFRLQSRRTAPTAIADYMCSQYAMRAVGRTEPVVEQLYAITTERRLTDPAIWQGNGSLFSCHGAGISC
jgi:hypothetical protein